MAVPYKCFECGGDGTRCDCHKKRQYKPYVTDKEKLSKRMRDNEIDIARNIRLIKELKLKKR